MYENTLIFVLFAGLSANTRYFTILGQRKEPNKSMLYKGKRKVENRKFRSGRQLCYSSALYF